MANNSIYSVIKGSGRYIPEVVKKNSDFFGNEFYDAAGQKIDKPGEEIIEKFYQITGIEERRYVSDDLVASDIGYFAAKDALETSGTDKEKLDYIIVAHNFGDVQSDNRKADFMPSIAARVKHKLQIKNPYTVAYDVPFGCPGWIQAMIQADYYIKSGDAKKILVVGTETLSRVADVHDRDGMIYSDGAGAIILEAKESDEPIGILSHKTRSDTLDHAYLLWNGPSNNPDLDRKEMLIKMQGRKLYEYALTNVPQLIKDTIDKIKLDFSKVKKILIHQANEKMDEAMLKRLFRLYKVKDIPKNIMPMTIAKLGNNSIATLPILFDLLIKGELKEHSLIKDDHFVFASVGAGMNVNAVVYKMP
ncbi:MAG: 3-oxoacyl-ACP synthase [Bacteroidetes bacterium 4572_117]|nr:MAG: 3-oxoacyl-ACP synthase [Bacteroidetes bacterium 4572_117]